jgi:outer membrane protein insertion porin family
LSIPKLFCQKPFYYFQKNPFQLLLLILLLSVSSISAQTTQRKPGLIVEEIRLAGNNKTRPYVIQNYLPFQKGDLITKSDVAVLQANLDQSEFFRNVNVYTQPGTERGKVQVYVEVEERKGPFFQLRGGFNELSGWYFSPVGLHFNNLFGRGNKLGTEFLIGDRVVELSFSYLKPYIFGSEFNLGIQLSVFRSNYVHFIENEKFVQFVDQGRFDIFLAGAKGWQRHFRFAFSATNNNPEDFIHQGGSNGEEVPLPPQLDFVSQENQINRFQISVQEDSRDNRVYPRRGFWGGLFFDQASQSVGSYVDFYKLIGDVRYYQKLPLKAVASIHLQGGRVTENVPFYEKFYLGGPNSLRGYDDRSLTPLGYASRLVLGQVELRFPLSTKNYPYQLLSGVFFYDSGFAWNDDTTFSFSDLMSGAGFGFRFNIPIIGILRLDFAYPLPQWNDVHVYLSLGQTF